MEFASLQHEQARLIHTHTGILRITILEHALDEEACTVHTGKGAKGAWDCCAAKGDLLKRVAHKQYKEHGETAHLTVRHE